MRFVLRYAAENLLEAHCWRGSTERQPALTKRIFE
jgi:hypothetical protein